MPNCKTTWLFLVHGILIIKFLLCLKQVIVLLLDMMKLCQIWSNFTCSYVAVFTLIILYVAFGVGRTLSQISMVE